MSTFTCEVSEATAVLSGNGGSLVPGQVVSLWDIMNEFGAEECCRAIAALSTIEARAELANGTDPVSIEALAIVQQSLKMVAVVSRSADLPATTSFVERLLNSWQSKVSSGEFVHTSRNLRKVMESKMKKRMFFALLPEMNEYYKAERPFGDAVFEAFPSARFDITEAGTCLAVHCNVAAALHLMRATEVGMRELGKDRRIPCALDQAIDFEEWGHILQQLEDAVKVVQQWPNSHTKEDAHKFYNGASVELRAFNDGWRRHAAHVRPVPEMQNDEALALWGHVSRFMKKLSTRIGEGRYTPMVW